MTSDEFPRESEPAGDMEPSEPKSIVEPDSPQAQSRSERSQPPTDKAEIILRKHHICPYLGLRDDRTVVAMLPTPAHACFARKKHYSPSLEHQFMRCLSPNYPGCSIYPDQKHDQTADDSLYALQDTETVSSWQRWGRWLSLAVLLVVLVGALAFALMRGLLPVSLPAFQFPTWQGITTNDAATPPPPTSAAAGAAVDAPTTPTPEQASETTTPPATNAPGSQATPVPQVAQVAQSTATNTPRTATSPSSTAGEGETFSLTPSRADVGWWGSGQTQAGQIGDSFLYAGVYEQQAYISLVRFDLRRIPRGARIENATLRLTGLRDNLFDRSSNSSWMVQLISEGALPELAGNSFFNLYELPASFQLVPDVTGDEVGPGRVNEWTLDSTMRGWLYQQLLDGATSVVVRIVPLENAGNALFAWDSGHGSESSGAPPELRLSLGPVPPTPPPTATRPQLVATLTPTPENVMTVVALTPAAPVQVPPTNTPVPPEVVTPTPVAIDLPAVQTAAVAEGRPPVLINTPVPANAATATTNAAYATAVALTTGTFTPVPTNYVTPVLNYPSPPAENVATAAARSLEATAIAQSGTPTPTRNPNAVDAIYVYATETPANQETAVALIVEQNRIAVTTGTPTPTPWNLVVITRVPEPTPTPIPLFIPTSQLTPSPTPTATRLLTDDDFGPFRGKILFLSDRGGPGEVWVLDPQTGDVVGTVTDERLHSAARERLLTLSPDGKEQAIVQAGTDAALQIKIENFEQQTIRQLTHVMPSNPNMEAAIAYDPAWSPRGDQIAFVGTMSNGDEIYTIPVGGGDPIRLTFNTWEWDKHPTWSPDGTQIAFFSNRETGRRQIWIMNADGSNQRNLSNSEFEDWDPVWVR